MQNIFFIPDFNGCLQTRNIHISDQTILNK